MMEHLSSYHHHPNHHNQHNVQSNVPPGAQHHRAQSTTAFDRSNNNQNPTTSSFWANFLVNLSVNRRPTGRNGPGSGWGSPPSSPVFSMVTSAMDASGDIDHHNHNHHHRRLPIVSNQSSIGHHQRSLPQQDQCESESKPESSATTTTGGGGGGSQLMVHSLNVTNIESRFRKSWGNFINIFDGQGRQKICITKHELTNYLQLQNYAHPQSPFTFYATLFAGNYPKPLYNASGTCWRMRYNVFVTGIVGPIGHSHHPTSSDIGGTGPTGDDKTEEEEEEGPDGTNPKPDQADKPGDEDNVVHLGELHIYFHVERGHLNPLYQNLCYFFDRSMLSLAGADLDNESVLESVPGSDCPSMMSSSCPSSSKAQTYGSGSGCCPFSLWPVRAQLEQCARQLKLELSYSQFIQQFYFPIDKSRFRAADQSVDYFDLRQKDLRAAIRIVNDKVPFSFLHRAASLSRSCATISNAKQSSQPLKDSSRRNLAPASSTKLTTSSSSSSITSSQASMETTTTIEDEDEISPGPSTIGQMGVRNRMYLAGTSRVPNCGGPRNSHTRNAAKLL